MCFCQKYITGDGNDGKDNCDDIDGDDDEYGDDDDDGCVMMIMIDHNSDGR